MTANDSTVEKRIVTELAFTSHAVRRVTWEQFEFTIVGPYQVRVTSASYGHRKHDHSYIVSVEERDGLPLPAECDCPGDIHHDTDCAHKLALATIGGPTVLNAAIEAERGGGEVPPFSERTSTATERLQPDGGTATCPNGETWCDGPEGDDLPCFPCFEPEVGADE